MTDTAEPVRTLPSTLALAPHRSLLRLDRRSRLIGLDPAVAVAVEDLPPPLAEMLDELADPVPAHDLVMRAVDRGAEREAAERLLAELVAAGAVVDAEVPRRRDRNRATSTVTVSGSGPLAVGMVLGLAAAGVGTIHVDCSGVVLTDDVGTGFVDADRGMPRSAATGWALARLFPGAATSPPPQRARPDLVVLADAGTPDPARVAALHRAGDPHLVVRVRDGAGIVGPLVLPGRTACLECLEIRRCSDDPAWPLASAQLVDVPGRADPACVVATTGLGTAQALAALDAFGGTVAEPLPTIDATLELRPDTATVRRMPWPPHPACRCGASRPATGDRGGMTHPPAPCTRTRRRDTIEG